VRPRLLLADDHTLLREGLRFLLEPEFEVAGSVEDGQALLVAAEELTPDVILLDISMPLLNGIDAARRLRKIVPAAKLIFLTMHADADYVAEAFRAGGAGYLLKRAACSELLTAIRDVLNGRRYVSPLVASNTVELLIAATKPEGKWPRALTPRRRQVLQLVAEGRTRKEIAELLSISVKTVEFHKSMIMRELNLKTSADFTMYAIEHGLIASQRSS
jgi:DNA-binding NarL/FixJ family response regulator